MKSKKLVSYTPLDVYKRQALLHEEGVLAESNRDIKRTFILQAGINPDLKKPVGHIALSYSPVDAPKLTDGKMVQLAQEYMREMKITDTQYIIVRHQDREHPHVHICLLYTSKVIDAAVQSSIDIGQVASLKDLYKEKKNSLNLSDRRCV